jgi:hypothetical protein
VYELGDELEKSFSLRNIEVEGEWIKRRLLIKEQLIEIEKKRKNINISSKKEENNKSADDVKRIECKNEKSMIDDLIFFNIISWRDVDDEYSLVCVYSQFQLGLILLTIFFDK